MKTNHFLIVFCSFLFIANLNSGLYALAQEYLSPEHICHSKKQNKIYVGYSTAPGIAVFNIENASITSTIQLPSPISGMCVNEQERLLFAGCVDNERRILVINLESEKVIKTIKVGYHPSGIAMSPDGTMIFVSNRFSNDISVIDTKSFREKRRIDVVREPTAISVSPDGTLVAVTNLLPETSALDSYISAKVTLIDSKNLTVINNVELPDGSYALKDVVFSHDGMFIYVTHLIGRYNVLTSQIEKGWINTNALSIIDARTRKHFTTVLLDDIYEGAANPHGICLSDDDKKLFVAISGTHELFVIDRVKMHERIAKSRQTKKTYQYVLPHTEAGQNISLFDNPGTVELSSVVFEEIQNELGFLASIRTRIPLAGKGPRQMLFINDHIYVTSYFSDALEVVSLKDGRYETDLILFGDHKEQLSIQRYGEQLFHDASQCFQQWQSCASCHPGNARVDGLNWDLMNDGFGNPKNTKSMLYAHVTPPAMVTGIRPNAEWAVRAGFKHIQFFDIPEQEAEAVDAYLRSLKPIASPYLKKGKLSSSAKKGKMVFERVSCTHCHSGPYFTNGQKYEMAKRDRYDKQNTWDTPTLIELWRTAPYLHSGKYAKLEDVFKIEQHGLEEPLPEQDIKDLVEYISSL